MAAVTEPILPARSKASVTEVTETFRTSKAKHVGGKVYLTSKLEIFPKSLFRKVACKPLERY